MKNLKQIINGVFNKTKEKHGKASNKKRIILIATIIVLLIGTTSAILIIENNKDNKEDIVQVDEYSPDEDSETPEEKTATEEDRENTDPEEEVNGAVEDIKTQPTIDTPEGVVQDQSSVPKTQGGISGSGGETTTTKPSTSSSSGSGGTSSSSGSGSTTTTKPSTTPTRESASSVEAKLRKDTYRTGQNGADMSKFGTASCSCTPAFLSSSMPIINSFIAGSISADSARSQLQSLNMTGDYEGVEGYGTLVTKIYSITIVDVTSKGSGGFNGAANAAYELAGTGVQNLSVTYDSSYDTYRTKGILVNTCVIMKQN